MGFRKRRNTPENIFAINAITNEVKQQTENKIMQGTVWAGLICTTSMDELGKEAYNDLSLVYKFRDKVAVPPLEMVDNIITTSKCVTTTVELNATVNSTVKRKKLGFMSVLKPRVMNARI